MKRFRVFLAIAVAVSLVFTGCGKKTEESGTEPTSEAAENSGEADAVAKVVDELDSLSQQLKPLVENAFQKGIMDKTRYDEFNHYLKRISDIKISKGSSDAVKKELSKIKEELAVIASQVSASNDVIDSLVKPADAIKTEDGDTAEDTAPAEAATEAPAAPVKNEPVTLKAKVSEFSADYISFQNECSRRVDLGEITQEDYTQLLDLGIRLAQLKEKTDAGQVNQGLENELNSIKDTVHSIAVKVNSSLAAEFE